MKVNFAKKYAEICNSYKEYDKGLNFNRRQIDEALLICGVDLKYEAKDKSYYRDYSIGAYKVRITITFKFGFIECFYTFWSSESEERVRGRFNSIACIETDGFSGTISHNFPIATSLNDLGSILKKILELHNELIGQFQKELSGV